VPWRGGAGGWSEAQVGVRYTVNMTRTPLGEGLEFRPVDSGLIAVRIQMWVATGIPLLAGLVALCLTLWRSQPWTWVFPALVLIVVGWRCALLPRQVRAIGYAERDNELVIRRGVMWQRLDVIPYGRMQHVDVTAGPLLARRGLAKVQLTTASVASNGQIPGVTAAEAQRLREKLTQLGSARMEGL